MSDDSDIEDEGRGPPPLRSVDEITTVARAVLNSYFDKLADTEGFSEIAAKLRRAVLYDHQFNDAAIKAALFPDET